MKYPVFDFLNTNPSVLPYRVRVVRYGGTYGLNDCLVNEERDPLAALVEFYDRRYEHTPNGQFVSRYYARTLLGDSSDLCIRGLDLQGDVPAWKVDADSMRQVIAFVTGVLSA